MNIKRAFEIVNNNKICDVYYNDEPVWIQEIQNNVVKVGFMNIDEVKDVNVTDLHE